MELKSKCTVVVDDAAASSAERIDAGFNGEEAKEEELERSGDDKPLPPRLVGELRLGDMSTPMLVFESPRGEAGLSRKPHSVPHVFMAGSRATLKCG
jgi:hypothetical protein